MLIDSTHKRWIRITAILAVLSMALWWVLDYLRPGGLTGGSTVGLWYGIAGTALMVFAGLLSALRKVPSWWWIGSRKTWLRGHIWLGLLSAPLILCHACFRWGGAITTALWIVLILTLLTGVFGLFLQQILPRTMTTRVTREAPYEQIPHLCQVLRHKADDELAAIWGPAAEVTQASYLSTQVGIGAKVQLQEFYERQLRPFLTETYRPSLLLSNPMRAEAAFSSLRALPGLAEVKEHLDRLEDLCEERRQLAEQERLQRWLHTWLLVHIPLSVALLVLGVVHIVMSLYY